MKKLSRSCCCRCCLPAASEKKDQPWLGYGEGDTAYDRRAAAGLGDRDESRARRRWCIAATCCSCWTTRANRPAREQAGGALGAGARQPETGTAPIWPMPARPWTGRTGWRATMPARPPSAIWRWPTTASPRRASPSCRRRSPRRKPSLTRRGLWPCRSATSSPRPKAGCRTSISAEANMSPATTPVVSVLPPENIYVRFFVPETELAQLQAGPEGAHQLRRLHSRSTRDGHLHRGAARNSPRR